MTIVPNPTAMCVNCLRSRVDITEGIPKQATVYFCKGCERYLSPPSQWVPAQLESRELLALCLKRLKGLNKVRLIDAGFIWTEPHSKRLKVRLKVQQEVSGAILEQIFVVEYVVHSQMCEACHRREAKDTWKAVVQIRQKVSHKKTFFYLEQLIIRHQAQQYCVNIKAHPDGLDFFFGTKSDAKRMVDFLSSVVPQRYKTSEQLISHDIHTNEFNFKYTFSVELPPICRDDVVCLPPALAKACGNISQIVICTRVTGSIHFVNPLTLQTCEVSSTVYWRQPFGALCSGNHLTEYIVLDIEPATAPDGSPISSTKHVLAHATLARVRDFGVNDCQMTALTHLGHLLQPGDCAWGFDLSCSNTNDEYANRLDLSHYEVILVKKSYSERRKRHRRRNWKLKLLTKEELNIKGDPNAEFVSFCILLPFFPMCFSSHWVPNSCRLDSMPASAVTGRTMKTFYKSWRRTPSCARTCTSTAIPALWGLRQRLEMRMMA